MGGDISGLMKRRDVGRWCVVKRARDEAIAQRKTSRNIGNEVMRFWMKVEKVVRFKAQSAVDAKRKTVMDKHLDFLLGQTERYSTMLATKLTGVPEESLAIGDATDAAEAADAAAKSAQVELLGIEQIGAGLVSVRFSGEVAAVQVDAVGRHRVAHVVGLCVARRDRVSR